MYISRCAVLALLVLYCCALNPVSADMVAYWNLNNKNENGTEAFGHLPDTGTGFLQIDTSWERDFSGANRGITAFSGTVNNATPGTPAGLALALQGGFEEDNTLGNPPNNGKWMQVQANLSDYVNPVLSLAMFRSFNTPGGFNNNQFSWSTDGTNFTNFGAAFDPGTAFGIITFDLSAVNALNHAAFVALRITFNGATSNGGHNRIDNIQLNAIRAVPEPTRLGVAMLLSLTGLIFVRNRNA